MAVELTDGGYIKEPYQSFIHVSRYTRWLEEEKRRETYVETFDRYLGYMRTHLSENNDYQMSDQLFGTLRDALIGQSVGPSMRALMTAGPALERNNVAGYNCAYIVIDDPRAFDECLYILMCGTGVGFSVERQYVDKLPSVAEYFERTDTKIAVADSKEGWAKALRELIALLYAGQVPSWDLSQVRKKGERLKIFGGRASGPGPLDQTFSFAVDLFQKAAGRKLTSLEAHDLVCKIADAVVSGGVRRSALISLSDLSDLRMAHAKSGEWYLNDGHRRLANNSVAYTSKPDIGAFMDEWKSLYDSKSGERGVFNRQASVNQAKKNGRRNFDHQFGTNPCSEIILRPNQFCNLTTVVVRPEDTLEDLANKVEWATILGTFQATLTNFKYLRKVWKKNTEEERLLGVSMTGQLSHPVLSGQKGLDLCDEWLSELKALAVRVNKRYAEELGIPQSAAITCVKPEGTGSQMWGVEPGMHTAHSPFWFRNVRCAKTDPVTKMLTETGVPSQDDVMDPDNTTVFTYPRKAPDGALTRKDLTAIQHLELWLTYQRSWCEHKPSITVSVREHEWLEVGAWVYAHFDEISGISFLPYSDHIYQQAPYEECTQEEYETLMSNMPTNVRWEDLVFYESEDGTAGARTLACSADGCEDVDLVAVA